ncbi:MAG: tetratricopeptide repeat protein [Acidobacteriota bacterium]
MANNQLGLIYSSAGHTDRAVAHYRESIRYHEAQGDVYGASQARFNVAVTLAQAGRLHDALEYARAALRGFESFGEREADWIQRTRQVIEAVEEAL